MLPQSKPRKKKNSSKINLLISLVFHTVIILGLAYVAARQGLLGDQLKRIAVEMVQEKKPEKPEEQPEELEYPEPPVQEARVETPEALVAAPPPERPAPPPSAAPPAAAPPAVAPPAVQLPAFHFGGGRAVQTSSDPVEVYRSFIEHAFRARWNKPEDLDDEDFVAEVEVTIDRNGAINSPNWRRTSGNARWDDSVRRAVATLSSVNRPPPTNFPPRFLVRFDVQEVAETALQ